MKVFCYSLEVEDYQESLSSDFLEVEDDKESRRRTFSRVGHKHGTLNYMMENFEPGLVS